MRLRNCLLKLVQKITKHPRYDPDVEWDKRIWVANIFRAWEYLAGRRFGIKIESSASTKIVYGTRIVEYKFYTLESVLSHIEVLIRELFKDKYLYIHLVDFEFAIPNQTLKIPFIYYSIALDTSGSGTTTSTTPLTFNYTCTGTNLVLVATVGNTATSPTLGTPTYNSVSMTQGFNPRTNGNNMNGQYILVAPSTGSNSFSESFGGTSPFCNATLMSYSGAKQSGQPDAITGNTGAGSPSLTVTTVADNSWAIFGVTAVSVSGFSKTSRGSGVLTLTGTTGMQAGDTNAVVHPAGNSTGAWSAGTTTWAGCGLSIAPATGSAPTVTTSAADTITSTSANGNGNVTSDGGNTVTERGFVWSTSANPTTSDNKVTVAGTTGSYSGSMTGLTSGTLYHYRAYAINSVGTSYGADTTFTTVGIPSVTTSAISNVTTATATGNGSVDSDGGAGITERGFVWSTSPNPTIANNKGVVAGTTGAYTGSITGLSASTSYHYRAYAINSVGTAYGSDQSFTTPSPTLPANHKYYYYKVYQNGSYVATWTKEVINEPQFTANINNGPGELLINLGRKFDDFGENVDVTLNNQIQCYVVDKEAPNGKLLYIGYISGYRPIIKQVSEMVEITVLSYAAELQRMYLRDVAGNTTITYTNQDISVIFKDLIDKYRAQGGTLNYSATSIQRTNTIITYTFVTQTIKQCLDLLVSISPSGWFYRIDPDNTIYFQPKNVFADNMFTLGLNVENVDTFRRVESVVNQILFTGGGSPSLYLKFSNSSSQSAYGLYEQIVVNQKVTDATVAGSIANNILNNLSLPEIRSVFDIVDSNGPGARGYDIESIKVGQTLTIKNLSVGSKTQSLWDVAQWDIDVWDETIATSAADVIQILSISYAPDSISIEASSRLPQIPKRIEDVSQSLVTTQTVNNPTIPS